MNNKIGILILIIAICSGYYYFRSDDQNSSTESEVLEVNETPNVEIIENSTTTNDTPDDKTIHKVKESLFEEIMSDYGQEIDNQFNFIVENTNPVTPFDAVDSNLFESVESAKDYLSEFIESPVDYPREVSEIVRSCQAARTAQRKSKRKKMSESMLIYLDSIYDGCKDLTGTNDVFFDLEQMAIKGDVIERINYIDTLINAIDRRVIKPTANPIEYLDRRNMAISWLKELSSDGVGTAAARLSFLYQAGTYVETDNALGYIYAHKANQANHEIINAMYLSKYRNRLTDEEIEKIKRISKNKLP